MAQNVNYYNGYTTTAQVRELKDKIKQIKIDINRLVNISLQYTNIDDHGKFPKELIHINDIVFRMVDEIDIIGAEIKRLRQKESEKYLFLNRNYNKVNNEHMKAFVRALTQSIYAFDKYPSHFGLESTTVLSGFSQLTIYEVDSIHDFDINSEWAAFSPSAKNITHDFMRKCDEQREYRLSHYIESNMNDIRVNEDGLLYIIYKAVENDVVKYYKVYFDIN